MILHGRNIGIYINGVDISGDANEINPVSEMDMAEVATFGAINHQAYPGLAKDSGTIQALYNSTSAAIFQNLVQSASGYAMMIPFAPTTAGTPVYCTNELNLKNNSIKSVVTDVNRATFSFETKNRPFEAGTLLFNATATTGATSVNNSTSTLLGGAGYLQVFSVSTAGGALTVRISTSSTGAFAGEEVTTCLFTAASSSETQRVAISGTIEKYAKINYNAAGNASTYSYAVGLVRY